MINILFWKVTFVQSESSTLDFMVTQASERIDKLTTLMVYCCVFENERSREALLTFTASFLRRGQFLSRLWLEKFFNSKHEVINVLAAVGENSEI